MPFERTQTLRPGGLVHVAGSVDDRVLYRENDDLCAWDGRASEPAWRVGVAGTLTGHVTAWVRIPEGVVAHGTLSEDRGTRFTCVDPDTGTVRWRVDLPLRLSAHTVQVWRDQVLVYGREHPGGGACGWTIAGGEAHEVDPIYDHSGVVVGDRLVLCAARSVDCLDLVSREYSAGAAVWGRDSPLLHRGTLYVAGRESVFALNREGTRIDAEIPVSVRPRRLVALGERLGVVGKDGAAVLDGRTEVASVQGPVCRDLVVTPHGVVALVGVAPARLVGVEDSSSIEEGDFQSLAWCRDRLIAFGHSSHQAWAWSEPRRPRVELL